ncbi:MAG: cell envelope integrity protein TolA [Acidobacteria bacterium]|nr:cell envelope integrity protein TolA [Acidobacteriota bacterium]
MKREVSLTEAFFMALIVLLIFFVTADKTMFRAMRVEFQPDMQANVKKNKSIKFTFVDLPDDKESPNPTAKLYSDISRKAAGGIGAPSQNALSKGNTSSVVIHKGAKVNQREMKQRPAPVSRAKQMAEKKEQGKTGLEQAGKSGKASKAKPLVDVSRIFSATNPEIYDSKNGGQVIPGNFSIDTQGFDLGPYAKKVQQIVRANWKVPEVARNLYLKGLVVIAFDILKDGAIRNIELLKKTSVDPMDMSAEFAIKYSNPFPPLPDFIKQDKIHVKWSFYYNERPED